MSGVYLIHFSQPISEKHTCQHYIGSAADIAARFAEHKSGQAARLTQVAVERGIEFEIVRTWKCSTKESRQLEKKLKAQKNGPKFCPLCSGH